MACAPLLLEQFIYKKRNFAYAFVRHRLFVLCKQSVGPEIQLFTSPQLINVFFIIYYYISANSRSVGGGHQTHRDLAQVESEASV